MQKPKISTLDKLMAVTDVTTLLLAGFMLSAGISMFFMGGPLILGIALTSMATIGISLGVAKQLVNHAKLLDGKLKGQSKLSDAQREIAQREARRKEYGERSILKEVFNIVGASLLMAASIFMFMVAGPVFFGVMMATVATVSILFDVTSMGIKIANRQKNPDNPKIKVFRTGGKKLGGENIGKSRLVDEFEKQKEEEKEKAKNEVKEETREEAKEEPREEAKEEAKEKAKEMQKEDRYNLGGKKLGGNGSGRSRLLDQNDEKSK